MTVAELRQKDMDAAASNQRDSDDPTGRDRLVSNVVFSWAAHFVFIVAGFVMPRMIDRRLGQELLGVWDFAWSLVSYFELVQAGVGSSVNRYVAKYRAAGDQAGVNRAVSSALCVLSVSSLVTVLLTVGLSVMLGRFFGAKLGENVTEAQWVVFFLGLSVAVQIVFGPFHGVLTGCHRWGLHNSIKSGWHAVRIVAMVVALVLGARLWTVAIIMLLGQVLADITRVIAAHRVCAGLCVRPSLARWGTIKRLFRFGGKTLIPGVSHMLVNQTTGILIVAYIGPAALALYARPRSLIYQMRTLVGKMAYVLTPTTSSLQSADDMEGIRDLLIKSVRYAVYMIVPMMLLIAVFGDAVMQFWMGADYADLWVPAILAIGSIFGASQLPAYNILSGLNAHGRSGLALLICSVCSFGLMFLMLGVLDAGLIGAAIAVMLPATVMHIVYLPALVCRRVGMSKRRYLLGITVRPAVHILPFAASLVIGRLVFSGHPAQGLLWGGGVGSVILTILYWRYVLPDRIRDKFLKITRLGKFRSHAALS